MHPAYMKYLALALALLIADSARCQTYDTSVDVGTYRLHFHIIKGTGMPILFEGGAGAEADVWDTILQPLEDLTHATLITYDRAGFGSSTLDTSNHDLGKHGLLQDVQGLETALKKLGYDRRGLVLVAHSYGGFEATLYAARHPSNVKAAVLIDANLEGWFTDHYVDSVTQLRKKAYATAKDINWANYYMGMNLPNTIALMRKTPFPANIPVIELISELNFPNPSWHNSWRDVHLQFAAAEPNREAIIANGCGHFIFRDNPPLAIAAIVKAYAAAQSAQAAQSTRGPQSRESDAILKRYLAYSLDAFNETKKREIQTPKPAENPAKH